MCFLQSNVISLQAPLLYNQKKLIHFYNITLFLGGFSRNYPEVEILCTYPFNCVIYLDKLTTWNPFQLETHFYCSVLHFGFHFIELKTRKLISTWNSLYSIRGYSHFKSTLLISLRGTHFNLEFSLMLELFPTLCLNMGITKMFFMYVRFTLTLHQIQIC